MSEEPRIRRRQRLRDKDAAAVTAFVTNALGGGKIWDDRATLEEAEFLDRKVLVVNNHVWGVKDGDSTFLSVRGLLALKPAARFVTVDMGAVKFVCNGADVMAPGIVEADPALKEGDWCWIRDERNKQPLAVGKCLVAGASMPRGKGKAVKSIHYLGDKLWNATAE